MRGLLGRGGRQRRKGLDFAGSVEAVTGGIEHENDAPALRELDAADDRRDPAAMAATAIDDDAALGKQTDADARARATAQPRRVAGNVEWQTADSPQAGGGRKRQMGAGPQTRMAGNHGIDADVETVAEAEEVPHHIQVTAHRAQPPAHPPKSGGRAGIKGA